jgi:hypothetical protein
MPVIRGAADRVFSYEDTIPVINRAKRSRKNTDAGFGTCENKGIAASSHQFIVQMMTGEGRINRTVGGMSSRRGALTSICQAPSFAKYSATWAANHGDRIIRRFDRDIFPWIGGRPIAEVTAPELWLWCGGLKTGAYWKTRTGRLATADRCSAMPWRPGGQRAIHAATCAARCPQ